MSKFSGISNPGDWVIKSGTTILEQAVLSGTNFIMGLLVGRWLSPELFGVFSIAFTVYLFLSGIQNSIILEPMSVLGPSTFQHDMHQYIKKNTILNRIFWLGIVLLFSLISIILRPWNLELSNTILGLAIATPFIFMFSFLRRRVYIALKPQIALVMSLIYSLCLLGSLFMLNAKFGMFPEIAFYAIGGANMVATVVGFWIDPGFSKSTPPSEGKLTVSRVTRRNWQYGRWVLAGSVVFWLVYLSNIPLLGILLDLKAAGIYRAVQNVTVPIDRILSGLSLLVVPILASRVVNSGIRAVRKLSIQLSLAAFSVSVVFLILISIFRGPILGFIYGKQTYLDYAWLIPLIGTISVMNSIGFGFVNGLRATEASRPIFFAYLWGSIATLSLSIPAIYFLGLSGAFFSQIASVALTIGLIVKYWKIQILTA